MFAPFRDAGGTYFASGKPFKIIDDWTARANAHRLLEGSWIGTTAAREVAEYIDDDSDEEPESDDNDNDNNDDVEEKTKKDKGNLGRVQKSPHQRPPR